MFLRAYLYQAKDSVSLISEASSRVRVPSMELVVCVWQN